MFQQQQVSRAIAALIAGIAATAVAQTQQPVPSGATAVQAQSAAGRITGTAQAGAVVILTAPGGVTTRTTARPDGSFTFEGVAPGKYTLTNDGATREVILAAGAATSVAFPAAPTGQSLEAVTVTGSRIQRDTFTSTSPVTVITREDTLQSGFASTTAALQGTAVTAGGAQINNAFGGFVVDGGPGVNTISLRNLGATRTLVLLNGKRLSPAGARGSVGSADLNVLPSAMVDRIEVLKDGASSIYGSDAVAGVVNVITKRNFSGLQLEAQYNKPQDGGGEEARTALTYGLVGNRGFFTGSLEVYDRRQLKFGERDLTRCQTDYRRTVEDGVPTGPFGSLDYIDPKTGQPKCYTINGTGSNGVTINTLGTARRPGVPATGSTGTTFNRFRPNANVTTGLPGYEGVGPDLNVRDTFSPALLNNSLISPARTVTGFLQGGLDTGLLGNAEAYFEGLVTQRKSNQVGNRQVILDYQAGNPLIPVSLGGGGNAGAGSLVTSNGTYQYRGFIDGGNYDSEQKVDFSRALVGFRGNLPLADWRYDTNVSYSRAKADYGFGVFLTDRVKRSLDAVATGGTIACRDPSGGCVAAPSLTPATIGGALPQDWLNYVYQNVVGTTKYTETIFNLGTNGPLFEMPFGPVRGAFGVEYRKAKIDDTPSVDQQNANLYNFTSSAVTRGSDSVKEGYGELEFPLIRALPGAEELTVNASGRWTDYKSYGNGTTWKLGVLYSPVSAVTLRGSIGTSYRAPALFEQFVGATTGFLSSTGDPCNNYGTSSNTSRQANCASLGLAPNFQSNSGIASVTSGGKDAGLAAETSKNKSFGIIFQPALAKSIGDISLAVDYYDIVVSNGVDRIGTGNILSLCYDSPSFSSPYCRLINRASGTNALTVNNSYVNVATDRVAGFDYTLRYVRALGPGTIRVNALVSDYARQDNKLFPNDPFSTFNGTIGAPKRTGVLDASYLWRAWTFRYGLDWVGKQSHYGYFNDEDGKTSTYKLDTPNYIRHNFATQYKADTWSIIVGVRNLTDKSPPQISQGFTNRIGNAPLYSGYDYVGRTWFVTGSYKFF